MLFRSKGNDGAPAIQDLQILTAVSIAQSKLLRAVLERGFSKPRTLNLEGPNAKLRLLAGLQAFGSGDSSSQRLSKLR